MLECMLLAGLQANKHKHHNRTVLALALLPVLILDIACAAMPPALRPLGPVPLLLRGDCRKSRIELGNKAQHGSSWTSGHVCNACALTQGEWLHVSVCPIWHDTKP